MNARSLRGNRWDELEPPPIGNWRPRGRISVCIPARDAGVKLERTLVGLAAQSVPATDFEIVLIDDRSDPPVDPDFGRLGLNGTIHRIAGGAGFGASAARNLAARHATGDVLVFLDADTVPAPGALAAMGRWFDTTDDALVLGALRFVDMDGISPDELVARLREPVALLSELRIPNQEWRGAYAARTRQLTSDEVDLFRMVTGAAFAVRRDRFLEVGGFCEIPLRGFGDTELGYRLVTNGALVIPEPAALVLHQGGATQRDGEARRHRRDRRPVISRLIPVGGFRTGPPRPVAGIPITPSAGVRVVAVDPDGARAVAAAGRIRRLGGSDVDVTVVPRLDPMVGFSGAFSQIWVSCDYEWGPGTLSRVTELLSRPEVGCVRVPGEGENDPLVACTSRALRRAGRSGNEGIWARVEQQFGLRWVAAESLGLRLLGDEEHVAQPGLRETLAVHAERTLSRVRAIGMAEHRAIGPLEDPPILS